MTNGRERQRHSFDRRTHPANHNQWMYALDVKLTERGKRMVRGKPQTIPAPSKNTWDTVYENAVFCTKQVVKIDSISTPMRRAASSSTVPTGISSWRPLGWKTTRTVGVDSDMERLYRQLLRMPKEPSNNSHTRIAQKSTGSHRCPLLYIYRR